MKPLDNWYYGLWELEHCVIDQWFRLLNTVVLTYVLKLKKSGSNTPQVELQEMGPSMDLVLRRVSLAAPDLSCKVPKQLKVRGVHSWPHMLECYH